MVPYIRGVILQVCRKVNLFPRAMRLLQNYCPAGCPVTTDGLGLGLGRGGDHNLKTRPSGREKSGVGARVCTPMIYMTTPH